MTRVSQGQADGPTMPFQSSSGQIASDPRSLQNIGVSSVYKDSSPCISGAVRGRRIHRPR